MNILPVPAKAPPKPACPRQSLKPTADEVRKAKENLPTAATIEPFLSSLSSRTYFTVLQTQDQRDLLSRLALLQSAFNFKVATKVAALAPAIPCTPADWRYLSIQVFERSGAGYFAIPTLMRTVAADNAKDVNAELVMVEAARALLDWGSTTTLDFFAFQTAIFYLLVAERYDEAAAILALAMRAILDEPQTYSSVSIQLLSINQPLAHSIIRNPNLRWHLVLGELLLLLQLSLSDDTSRAVTLIKLLRSISREAQFRYGGELARSTIHQFIAGVRFAGCRKPGATMQDLYRFLWSGQNAIRSMLVLSDSTVLEYASHLYDDAYLIPVWIDMELFHQVALRLLPTSPLKPEVLCHYYAELGVLRPSSIELDEMFVRHGNAYRDAGYQDAYVATELGRATHACERKGQSAEPRRIVLDALAAAPDITAETRARATVLIADTYFLEGRYDEAAASYSAVAVNPEWPDTYANHVRNRTLESLLAAGKPDDAAFYAIRYLRRFHRTMEATEAALLRAKGIYLLVEAGRFAAAVPLVIGLKRIARSQSNEKLQWLYTFFSAWLFSQWKQPDPFLPRVGMSIQNLESIDLNPDEESLSRWRAEDPLNVKADLYLASSLKMSSRADRALKMARDIQAHATGGLAALELAGLELNAGAPQRAAALLHSVVRDSSDPVTKLRWVLAALFPGDHAIPEPRTRAFFKAAREQFDAGEARVILLRSYAHESFRYFSVYDAKRETNEALNLSEQLGRADLEAELLWFKVIQHRTSFFSQQADLVRDLLRLCDLLAGVQELSAQRNALPEAVRLACKGQAEGSCMHALWLALEAELAQNGNVSFEIAHAACRQVLIDFGLLHTSGGPSILRSPRH